MAEMIDHRAAEAILQRAVIGAPIDEGDITRALSHLATCATCSERFEISRTAACHDVRDDLADAARVLHAGDDLAGAYPAIAAHIEECEWCSTVVTELVSEPVDEGGVVEPLPADLDDLFVRALEAALADPDPVTRERAAERLGEFEPLGATVLAALANAAVEDPDTGVRAAALRGLDGLDARVSIPNRLIEAWAASPAQAAPFIAGILGRLAGEAEFSAAWVTELVVSEGLSEEKMMLRSNEGAAGEIAVEKNRLWLTLSDLPSRFENTKPVVAVPEALMKESAPVEWAGGEPGLISAAHPVSGGSVRIDLGRVREKPLVQGRELFEHIYLLSPEEGHDPT